LAVSGSGPDVAVAEVAVDAGTVTVTVVAPPHPIAIVDKAMIVRAPTNLVTTSIGSVYRGR
jgi:hypothetical protein